ncbi:MAG: hypothetical protein ABSE67_12955, partial [Xanthobacteraceae bacterium]
MVDHRRDHALEAQEDSELNGNEHDREDDPDDCGDQSNPVMKQIAGCKREDEGHRARQRVMQKMKVCNSRNGMALNKTSLSMRPWLAADDDEIKFSERAIGG